MTGDSNPLSIKSWSSDDRPREKLRDRGRRALSDAELIAILIGSGSRNESAVSLAKRILIRAEHNLNTLGKLSIKQLMEFKGIGEAKAISIAAALELGRRRRESEGSQLDKVESSRSVYSLMHPLLGELPHEEFWVIFLNNANRVIKKTQISIGGMTGTLVDARIIMKAALEFGAVGIILVHNHPSGTLKPSQADKTVTDKIGKAGQLLDIKTLDHIIITEHAYFSFADEGLL